MVARDLLYVARILFVHPTQIVLKTTRVFVNKKVCRLFCLKRHFCVTKTCRNLGDRGGSLLGLLFPIYRSRRMAIGGDSVAVPHIDFVMYRCVLLLVSGGSTLTSGAALHVTPATVATASAAPGMMALFKHSRRKTRSCMATCILKHHVCMCRFYDTNM